MYKTASLLQLANAKDTNEKILSMSEYFYKMCGFEDPHKLFSKAKKMGKKV